MALTATLNVVEGFDTSPLENGLKRVTVDFAMQNNPNGNSAQLANQASPPDIRADNRGTQEQREAYSVTLRQIVWAEKMERIINALEVSREDIQDVVAQLRHADALNQILNISEKPVNQFIYSTYKETVFQCGDRVVVFRWPGTTIDQLGLKDLNGKLGLEQVNVIIGLIRDTLKEAMEQINKNNGLSDEALPDALHGVTRHVSEIVTDKLETFLNIPQGRNV